MRASACRCFLSIRSPRRRSQRPTRTAAATEFPGTGSFYKATCDPLIITAWWRNHPRALIGLPMGPASGVWCVDVDTPEDHADGVAGWDAVVAEHGTITTREHRSATGGPHLIFAWDPEQPIGCGKGDLPSGISVKGQGGYIVVPPSMRKQRFYTVYRDIDAIEAPTWLIELIKPKKRINEPWTGPEPAPAEYDEIAEAMRFVPNEEQDWDLWTTWGLAIYAATNGKGFAIFDEWSAKLEYAYDRVRTRERWKEITRSPPNRTGVNKIFKAAREHGWVRKAAPTYKSADVDADETRRRVRQIINEFLQHVIANSFPAEHMLMYALFGDAEPPGAAWAVNVDTGIGKTQIALEELAKLIAQLNALGGPVFYAVPTHKLGEKIDQRFAKHGIDARTFKGRTAPVDPNDPEGEKMCLNLKAIKQAMLCGADIEETCCKKSDKRCYFFTRCEYQQQIPEEGDQPQVWIVAHNMLFHYQRVFGNPVAVIIDESFWKAGLQGLQESDMVVVALDDIDDSKHTDGELGYLREMLRDTLARLPDGAITREQLIEFGELIVEDCGRAISQEWACLPALAQEPGMPERMLAHVENIPEIRLGRHLILIWTALRDFLDDYDIAVSGRLELIEQEGQRCIQWRGVRKINKKFQVPTLLLDATLPDKRILEVYHPHIYVKANIRTTLPPSVDIEQVLGSKTSSRKLDEVKNLIALRRYILQCYLEVDRQKTLVVTQKKAAQWLMASRLPKNIHVEWFNAIAGRDDFRDVRLEIVAGHTAPGPRVNEIQAGALTGVQPILVRLKPRFTWFPPCTRGIRLADGSGRATDCDQHPDAMVEAVRWQTTEAELLQAIGRARAVNRDAASPLTLKLVFYECLPIVVNRVSHWEPPSLLIETANDGLMLKSPIDLVRLWPQIWSNEKAAYRTVQQGVPTLPGFDLVHYQMTADKMMTREGWFNRSIIPDPATWLNQRLGPLNLL